MEKTNFGKLKMLPLIENENKSYCRQKLCYICKNKFNSNIRIYWKVWDHYHYAEKYWGAAHFTCSLRNKTTNEIQVVSQWIELWLPFIKIIKIFQ